MENAKKSKVPPPSTNANGANSQDPGIPCRHRQPAKPTERKTIDVIEIDLDIDDNSARTKISDNSVRLGDAMEEHSSGASQELSETADPVKDPETNNTAPEIRSSNPFAMFACAAPTSSGAARPADRSTSKATWNVHSNTAGKRKPEAVRKPASKSTRKSKEGYIKMNDMSKEEQDRITKKWHSLADPSAPLEVRRYQVLLATRLHARCQEPSVRKAMERLRESVPGGLTAEKVAAMDPDVLASHISNLQFYNVKAQQSVKAAQEILTLFDGKVPENELALTQITGVGKCFADLLSFVNTRNQHKLATAPGGSGA